MSDGSPSDRSSTSRPAPSFWMRRALATIISGAVLVLLTLGFAWLLRAASVPLPVEAVTPASVTGFVGNGPTPLLIDAATLADRLHEDNVVVLDLSDPRRYDAEHVPGAVHGWWQDTMSPFADVYGRRIQQAGGQLGYEALFRSLGIGRDTTVVVYDDDANRYAARLVWLLRSFGHERTMVLDGGLASWKGAGFDVSREPSQAPAPAAFSATPDDAWTISTTELQERYADPSLIVLDTRSTAEAADDLNGTIRVGMIPGALWLPWNETVRDRSGTIRPPTEIEAALAAVGVPSTRDQEIVVYGRFGVETGQPWLVLTLLGYRNVRVYDEGWASWAAIERLSIDPLPSTPLLPGATPASRSSTERSNAG